MMQPFPRANYELEAPERQPEHKKDLNVRLICPECRDSNPNIEEEFSSGDLVCRGCGLVLGDRIVDTRSEWRTFANEDGDDPSRVGAAQNPLYEGTDALATNISFRDGNTGASRELQRAAARLANDKSTRSVSNVFEQIQHMCDNWSLPRSVSDTAKMLYRRTDEEKLLRGKSVEAITAACIFIACRQAQVPRTFKEICELTSVPKKLIGQCYKQLERSFNLAPGATVSNPGGSGTASATNGANGGNSPATAITAPEDLMARYCNHLDLPPAFQAYCSEIASQARIHHVATGRSPVSIAAGVIYFTALLFGYANGTATVGNTAAGTQNEVATGSWGSGAALLRDVGQVASTSEGTVKLVYKLLWKEKDNLVSKDWFDTGKASWENLPTGEGREARDK